MRPASRTYRLWRAHRHRCEPRCGWHHTLLPAPRLWQADLSPARFARQQEVLQRPAMQVPFTQAGAVTAHPDDPSSTMDTCPCRCCTPRLGIFWGPLYLGSPGSAPPSTRTRASATTRQQPSSSSGSTMLARRWTTRPARWPPRAPAGLHLLQLCLSCHRLPHSHRLPIICGQILLISGQLVTWQLPA